MTVPICRGCAQHIKSWSGREYDRCAISPGHAFANTERSTGRCGVEAHFWTPKPSLWQRLGLKASQHLADTREATKREAQTRPNPNTTP